MQLIKLLSVQEVTNNISNENKEGEVPNTFIIFVLCIFKLLIITKYNLEC